MYDFNTISFKYLGSQGTVDNLIRPLVVPTPQGEETTY